MSRARTRRARIEERTLRIGFGIKRASEGEIGLPELLAFQPALRRRKPKPFGPFLSNQFFRLNHGRKHKAHSQGRRYFSGLAFFLVKVNWKIWLPKARFLAYLTHDAS